MFRMLSAVGLALVPLGAGRSTLHRRGSLPLGLRLIERPLPLIRDISGLGLLLTQSGH